jgi:DNA (cytosine-5)-methyltransferase 1
VIQALDAQTAKPVEAMPLGDENLLSISMTDAARMFGVPENVIAKRQKQTPKKPEAGTPDKRQRTLFREDEGAFA